jgi:hypothetical protein
VSTIGVAAALTAEHAEHLAQFRIPTEMLETAGVRSVSDFEARDMFGIHGHSGADLAGISFPYLSPITGKRVGGRIRLDYPLPEGARYLSESGCRHLFFPPFPKEWLADTGVQVIIVEAEKSGLAVQALAARVRRPMLVIGIGGCWGWRRKIGNKDLPEGGSEPETGPCKDFDLIVWHGRTVFLTFDSNAATNSSVQHARRLLARELRQRGATVQVAEVPAIENVNGPDDLIALRGDDAMLAVLDSATAAQCDVIRLEPGKLPSAIDDAEKILLCHSERLQIFQRAGELVRAFTLPEPRQGGGLQRPKGTLQLEPLSSVALTEIFDRTVEWRRIGKSGEEWTVDCPARLATAYLSRTGSWRVPVLEGIISAPIMRQDGTILLKPGYDADTGLLFVTREEWPTVPECPTRADAQAALKILLTPFSEFPFVAREDVAVHIAGILTAVQRRLLGPCPIFGYTAPAPRSGKSLLAESIAIIATGRPAPATTISGEREEVRKVITSALREGQSVINLDNLSAPLSSPELCIALTQHEYQDRVLGESRMLRLPTNTFWTTTGNNLRFRGDLSCRALICRIDAGMESPETRTFSRPQLPEFLKNNRRALVISGLTILRAYHVAGRPAQNIPVWGGFDDWSAHIRQPLVWLGLADPCKTREFVLADDPEVEESSAVLAALCDVYAGEFTVKDVVDRCGFDVDLRGSIMTVAAGHKEPQQIDSRRLGGWLRRVRDRIFGGLRLRVSRKVSGVACWEIRKVPAGGDGGFGGHVSVVENAIEPADGAESREIDSEQRESDPHDPYNHLHGLDEIAI